MVSYVILALAALCTGLLGLSMLFNPIQCRIGLANVSGRRVRPPARD